ncbi:ankyrin [Dichotomocladium elegans]|nr:ankyrin [Dichotomocladium elegans]
MNTSCIEIFPRKDLLFFFHDTPFLSNAMDSEGASQNEIMLAACRNDQDDLLEEVLKTGDVDINFTDSIGDTALHYAAKYGSLACLHVLLTVENIKLNTKDRIEQDTPLHKAVKYKDDHDTAIAIVQALLEAGCDARAQNREKQTPVDIVDPEDEDMKELFDQIFAADELADSDIAEDPADENYADDIDEQPSD